MLGKSLEYFRNGGIIDLNLLTWNCPHYIVKWEISMHTPQQYNLTSVKDHLKVQQGTQQNLPLGCDTSGNFYFITHFCNVCTFLPKNLHYFVSRKNNKAIQFVFKGGGSQICKCCSQSVRRDDDLKEKYKLND